MCKVLRPTQKPMRIEQAPVMRFSLYQRTICGYKQVSDHTYPERMAYKVWHSHIEADPLTYSIRPANVQKDKAQSHLSRFGWPDGVGRAYPTADIRG